MANGQPQVIVLGGINGAGKTTAARSLLADTLKVLTFVNADVCSGDAWARMRSIADR